MIGSTCSWISNKLVIGFISLIVWCSGTLFYHGQVLSQCDPGSDIQRRRQTTVELTMTKEITTTLLFDGKMAYTFALNQCEVGPRPSGSQQNRALGDYIIERLNEYGWLVAEQEFVYGELPIRNIIGRKGTGPVVILGAHYDTRPIADQDQYNTEEPIMGANDGASGVAILLEMARTLAVRQNSLQVWLVFFDAEDRGYVDGWPYCVGSEYMANNLSQEPKYMILLDMVGDLEQEIYWENHSDPNLMTKLWDIANELGYSHYFIPQFRWGLNDDHIPFLKRGIPAVDIIDFDYPYWHTTQDTCDKIGAESLERVGKVVQEWLLRSMQEVSSSH